MLTDYTQLYRMNTVPVILGLPLLFWDYPISKPFSVTILISNVNLKSSFLSTFYRQGSGDWEVKTDFRDFSGGPVVKTLNFHCRGCRFGP